MKKTILLGLFLLTILSFSREKSSLPEFYYYNFDFVIPALDNDGDGVYDIYNPLKWIGYFSFNSDWTELKLCIAMSEDEILNPNIYTYIVSENKYEGHMHTATLF